MKLIIKFFGEFDKPALYNDSSTPPFKTKGAGFPRLLQFATFAICFSAYGFTVVLYATVKFSFASRII